MSDHRAAATGLRIQPISMKESKAFVVKHHRHNRAPLSGLFAVAAVNEARELVGVAIVGRPCARMLQDGFTCEINRLCTDGTQNACSLLYGAATRAAKALGYRRLYTYTLAEESGASLKASGWKHDADLPTMPTWDRPSRRRMQTNLFGEATRPAGPKTRWVRIFSGELQ